MARTACLAEVKHCHFGSMLGSMNNTFTVADVLWTLSGNLDSQIGAPPSYAAKRRATVAQRLELIFFEPVAGTLNFQK